jgi:7-cyano-7-deazaguanine synthase
MMGVHLLFFDYGQKMCDKEIDASIKIWEKLVKDYPDKEIVFKNFGVELLEEIGGSALTDYNYDIKDGAEFIGKPEAWVPARNLVLLSLATAYADKIFLAKFG